MKILKKLTLLHSNDMQFLEKCAEFPIINANLYLKTNPKSQALNANLLTI